jgi:uncharacterized protein YecT (DUF1311 family)
MRLSDIFCFVALCSVSTANSEDLMVESLKDCDKNQLTMNFCARHFFDVADKKLNGLFKQQLTTLETVEAKMRFRNAQRAWVAFRDQDCKYQVPTRNESRTDWPMQYWTCMKDHTEHRVMQMKEFIQCTSDDCPR